MRPLLAIAMASMISPATAAMRTEIQTKQISCWGWDGTRVFLEEFGERGLRPGTKLKVGDKFKLAKDYKTYLLQTSNIKVKNAECDFDIVHWDTDGSYEYIAVWQKAVVQFWEAGYRKFYSRTPHKGQKPIYEQWYSLDYSKDDIKDW